MVSTTMLRLEHHPSTSRHTRLLALQAKNNNKSVYVHPPFTQSMPTNLTLLDLAHLL